MTDTREEETAAPEVRVALDLARRAVPIAVVLIAVCAAIWGWDGARSAGFSVGLVVVNFLAAAGIIAWGARQSPGVLAGAVLGGYIVRLGIVVLALALVKDAGWVERAPLFATLLITHMALLIWETRYVSLSLAYPGLKPEVNR